LIQTRCKFCARAIAWRDVLRSIGAQSGRDMHLRSVNIIGDAWRHASPIGKVVSAVPVLA
jgi:hypothetical protein